MKQNELSNIKKIEYEFYYLRSISDLLMIFNTFRFDVDLLTDSIAV